MSAECTDARTWLSAQRDGEADDDPRAHTHLGACAACQSWLRRLDGVTAGVNAAALRDAGPPDVVAAAMVAWDARTSVTAARRRRAGQVVLGAAGVTGLLLSAAAFAVVPAEAGHLGRDLLGFQLALAVGFLLCSRQPRRYGRGLLPVTVVAALAVLVPSAAEVAAGDLNLLAETSHLPVLGGLIGLLLLLDATREDDEPTRRPALP